MKKHFGLLIVLTVFCLVLASCANADKQDESTAVDSTEISVKGEETTASPQTTGKEETTESPETQTPETGTQKPETDTQNPETDTDTQNPETDTDTQEPETETEKPETDKPSPDTKPEYVKGDQRFEHRKERGEFDHLKDETKLYNTVQKHYAEYVMRQKYFDNIHMAKSIGGFITSNQYIFEKPTVLYIMNSDNADFADSVKYLDGRKDDSRYNFLIIVNYGSPIHNQLVSKPYSSKIMFDDSNVNVLESFVKLDHSYFVVIDGYGSITNAFVNPSDIDNMMLYTMYSKSVKSPNPLTKPSVVKPGDVTISQSDAFNNGFISHLDSTKDMARYEYLNINFGRNFHDFGVINSVGQTVPISSLVDGKRPTILCFLQDYQDDYLYNFEPLYKLRDKCNVIIIFTNPKGTPYNQEYVTKILKDAEEKAFLKAKEPQNYDIFKNLVLKDHPGLSGEELNIKTDEYIRNYYKYDKMRPFIYGSSTALTTPLLETNVRGIQLYLDRNGNLINISQTYYSVGGVFNSVIEKIGNYIAVEDGFKKKYSI